MYRADVLCCREASCLAIVAVAAVFIYLASPSYAGSFIMKSGEVIDGDVVKGSDISVFIKDETGLLKSVMLSNVAEVKVDLRNGGQVAGKLVGFRDDVFEILMDKWTLYVKDGRLVQSLVVYGEEASAIVPNAGGPAIEIDTRDPVQAPEPASGNSTDALKRAPM